MEPTVTGRTRVELCVLERKKQTDDSHLRSARIWITSVIGLFTLNSEICLSGSEVRSRSPSPFHQQTWPAACGPFPRGKLFTSTWDVQEVSWDRSDVQIIRVFGSCNYGYPMFFSYLDKTLYSWCVCSKEQHILDPTKAEGIEAFPAIQMDF